MKLLLFAACILILVGQPISAGFVPVIIKTCVKDIKVSAQDLALFYGTDMKEASKPVKCYLTCLFKSSGFIVDNEVSPTIVEMAKNKNNSDTTPQTAMFFRMVEACKDVKGQEECDAGYLLLNCFSDFGKAHFFEPQDSEKSL